MGKTTHPPRPVHTAFPELPMHFADTCADTVTQLLFPRKCRTLVSLKTAMPRIPAACPASLVHTAPLQTYLGSFCSQPKLPLWRKAVKCLQQSGYAGRVALTQDPSTFVNSALDFDHPFSPSKQQALKKCTGEQGPLGTRNPERQEGLQSGVPTSRALRGQVPAWGPHGKRKDWRPPCPP